MKFDNQLFDLSQEFYQKDNSLKNEVEEEVKSKQNNVLKIILSKLVELEHIKWSRRCKNCGKIQTTSKKPKEIEAQEVIEEINILQKKLDTIKNRRK